MLFVVPCSMFVSLLSPPMSDLSMSYLVLRNTRDLLPFKGQRKLSLFWIRDMPAWGVILRKSERQMFFFCPWTSKEEDFLTLNNPLGWQQVRPLLMVSVVKNFLMSQYSTVLLQWATLLGMSWFDLYWAKSWLLVSVTETQYRHPQLEGQIYLSSGSSPWLTGSKAETHEEKGLSGGPVLFPWQSGSRGFESWETDTPFQVLRPVSHLQPGPTS